MDTNHDATLKSALELAQFVLNVVLCPRHGRGASIHTSLDTVHAGGSILAALGRTQVHLILEFREKQVSFGISPKANSTYLHFAQVRLVHVVDHLRYRGLDFLALLLDHFACLIVNYLRLTTDFVISK